MRRTPEAVTFLATILLLSCPSLSHAKSLSGCGGRVGIYLQEDPMTAAYKRGKLGSHPKALVSHRPTQVELNLGTPLTFPQWKAIWHQAGLLPTMENVIVDFWTNPDWITSFENAVRSGRQVGIMSFAPIFSPNSETLPLDSFEDNPKYAMIRMAAVYGRALSIDAPPAFFFKRGTAYQNFTYQEIQWAQRRHLRVTVIVSPYGDDNVFLTNTQRFVSMLETHDAIPSEWVVENYMSSDGNEQSCEMSPGGIGGVASWLALNASTRGKSGDQMIHVYQGISSKGVVQ